MLVTLRGKRDSPVALVTKEGGNVFRVGIFLCDFADRDGQQALI